MAIKVIIRRQGAASTAPPLAERILVGPIITIGRDAASSLQLEDAAIAPEQAVIINEDGLLLLINRADGTDLNGEALARESRRPLADGDRLRLGSYLVSFVLSGDSERAVAAGSTSTAAGTARQPEAPPGQLLPGRAAAADTLRASSEERTPARDSSSSSGGPASANSFAAILDSLRTEEDRFYFQIENAGQPRQRVAVESAEMLLGWDETGQNITCEAANVFQARAVVRKDWSGVVVQPQGQGGVWVNGEAVDAARRLRNGDRLTLLPTAAATSPETHYLVFHEPASLVVLDSLLPQQLPPPVAARTPAADNGRNTEANQALAPLAPSAVVVAPRKRAGWFSPDRKYFGYFTFLEVLVMITGTLVAALAIFLILEYS